MDHPQRVGCERRGDDRAIRALDTKHDDEGLAVRRRDRLEVAPRKRLKEYGEALNR